MTVSSDMNGQSGKAQRVGAYGRVLDTIFELIAKFSYAVDPAHYLNAKADYNIKLKGSVYDRMIVRLLSFWPSFLAGFRFRSLLTGASALIRHLL